MPGSRHMTTEQRKGLQNRREEPTCTEVMTGHDRYLSTLQSNMSSQIQLLQCTAAFATGCTHPMSDAAPLHRGPVVSTRSMHLASKITQLDCKFYYLSNLTAQQGQLMMCVFWQRAAELVSEPPTNPDKYAHSKTEALIIISGKQL